MPYANKIISEVKLNFSEGFSFHSFHTIETCFKENGVLPDFFTGYISSWIDMKLCSYFALAKISSL